jgi:hypothetical protein
VDKGILKIDEMKIGTERGNIDGMIDGWNGMINQ